MACRDSELLDNIINDKYKVISSIENVIPKIKDEDGTERIVNVEHPLDSTILAKLQEIYKDDNDEYYLFRYSEEIKKLWNLLIEKSIKCLRYFDEREPFLKEPSKHPVAYGVNELGRYFDRYSEFESTLYGSVDYYRDHVIHVFRVWLLGIDSLLYNKGKYLEKIIVDNKFEVNKLEKLSIWTIIALTHDLGYPLEKAQEIIHTTKDMMNCFIANPVLSMDLSFSGVQNNMNDFVLRFMSSKMVPCNNTCPNKDDCKEIEPIESYVARLQPKYYFKFLKSLEKCTHGIVSSIIIYKLLLYFLESDFNINEDYYFDKHDSKQFYIRREILRSIASHTCKDIYHLKMETFSFLLIIADDCQEWGRKNISELYVSEKPTYRFKNIVTIFNAAPDSKDTNHICTITESYSFEKQNKDVIIRIMKNLKKQFDNYSSLFRDGQDTKNRNFTFQKKCELSTKLGSNVKYDVTFTIPKGKPSSFEIIFSSDNTNADIESHGENFLSKAYENISSKHVENKDQNTSVINSIKYNLELDSKE